MRQAVTVAAIPAPSAFADSRLGRSLPRQYFVFSYRHSTCPKGDTPLRRITELSIADLLFGRPLALSDERAEKIGPAAGDAGMKGPRSFWPAFGRRFGSSIVKWARTTSSRKRVSAHDIQLKYSQSFEATKNEQANRTAPIVAGMSPVR
jgi:hypothetical protein